MWPRCLGMGNKHLTSTDMNGKIGHTTNLVVVRFCSRLKFTSSADKVYGRALCLSKKIIQLGNQDKRYERYKCRGFKDASAEMGDLTKYLQRSSVTTGECR